MEFIKKDDLGLELTNKLQWKVSFIAMIIIIVLIIGIIAFIRIKRKQIILKYEISNTNYQKTEGLEMNQSGLNQ